jgi:hypothetical protein
MKKIQLKNLKVTSQITSLNADEAKDIKGGIIFRNNNNNNPIIPNLGKKLLWTVTEQRGEFVRHKMKFEKSEKG